MAGFQHTPASASRGQLGAKKRKTKRKKRSTLLILKGMAENEGFSLVKLIMIDGSPPQNSTRTCIQGQCDFVCKLGFTKTGN
jgi:hypothetical protein